MDGEPRRRAMSGGDGGVMGWEQTEEGSSYGGASRSGLDGGRCRQK